MLRSFSICLLTICCFYCSAQKKFSLRSFNTETGMPSNGIKGMQWDEETGFLWIATEAGVVRFNGIDFRLFTSDNTPRLSNDRMSFMIRNNQNRILTIEGARNVFEVQKNRLLFYRQFLQIPDE